MAVFEIQFSRRSQMDPKVKQEAVNFEILIEELESKLAPSGSAETVLPLPIRRASSVPRVRTWSVVYRL